MRGETIFLPVKMHGRASGPNVGSGYSEKEYIQWLKILVHLPVLPEGSIEQPSMKPAPNNVSNQGVTQDQNNFL